MADHSRIVALYNEGKTGIEIAEEVRLTWGRVYQILRKEGVTRHARRKPREPVTKIKRDRVVDKILEYLREHPLSTVIEVAKGIGHDNPTTVRSILSRLKKQGYAKSDEGNHPAEPYLWSLPTE